jgi:RNA polymerase sigma-70 factor (ECF subfamily)
MSLPDESELIAAARQGDVEAFCALVSVHQRAMYSLAFRFCGNHYDAEDLAQEVFMNAYRAVRRFRGQSTFHTWLRRIMVNSFLNHKRRKQLPLTDGDACSQYAVPRSDRTAFNNIMVQQVLQHLDRLPPRQRLMFLMKHQEGLTCEEIAVYFGASVGTVKKTLFRVVDRLRREFHTPDVVIPEERNARLSEIP